MKAIQGKINPTQPNPNQTNPAGEQMRIPCLISNVYRASAALQIIQLWLSHLSVLEAVMKFFRVFKSVAQPFTSMWVRLCVGGRGHAQSLESPCRVPETIAAKIFFFLQFLPFWLPAAVVYYYQYFFLFFCIFGFLLSTAIIIITS